MILDRTLQRSMLEKMSDAYPEYYDFQNDYDYATDEYKKAVTNLYYLMQHNLVESRSVLISKSMDGIKRPQFGAPTINQNGMDFLANDGGLSAMLNVTTIRIDTEQFRLILESRIRESNLPLEQKNQIISALQSLPSESIKHLSTKVVDLGWDNLDALMQLIQNSLF